MHLVKQILVLFFVIHQSSQKPAIQRAAEIKKVYSLPLENLLYETTAAQKWSSSSIQQCGGLQKYLMFKDNKLEKTLYGQWPHYAIELHTNLIFIDEKITSSDIGITIDGVQSQLSFSNLVNTQLCNSQIKDRIDKITTKLENQEYNINLQFQVINPLVKSHLVGVSQIQLYLYACNPQCKTCSSRDICSTCSLNQHINSENNLCECDEGYAPSYSIYPLKCVLLKPNNQENTLCDYSLIINMNDLVIKSDCEIIVENGQQFLTSKITLEVENMLVSAHCIDDFTIRLNIVDSSNPGDINFESDFVINYIPFPTKYIQSALDAQDHIDMKIPLNDISGLATKSQTLEDQIYEQMHFQLELGSISKTFRRFNFKQYIYTNRNQVETFSLNVDQLQTNGCKPGEECTVITDLTTEGFICEDVSCNKEKENNQFIVYEKMYVKIQFIDNSFTKKLDFLKAIFSNFENRLFNYNQFTKVILQGKGSIVLEFELVEPTVNGILQVDLEINNNQRLLQEKTTSKKNKQNFVINVVGKDQTLLKQANSEKSSKSLLLMSLELTILYFLLMVL